MHRDRIMWSLNIEVELSEDEHVVGDRSLQKQYEACLRIEDCCQLQMNVLFFNKSNNMNKGQCECVGEVWSCLEMF